MSDAPRPVEACRTCGAGMRPLGTLRVLGRHDARADQCERCGFVQLADPSWLAEAYAEAITGTDVGLLARCRHLEPRIRGVLACGGRSSGTVLDWGGGYGTLTRMLRDRGIDCRHWDPHCANIFARGFESELGARGRWDAVIAVEVLEHLVDPWSFFRPVAERTDLIIATTELVTEPAPRFDAWAYWGAEHGQHVSFHSARSLGHVAEALGMHYLKAGPVHVFSRRLSAVASAAMRMSLARRLAAAIGRRRSLIGPDHAAAGARLRSQAMGFPGGPATL